VSQFTERQLQILQESIELISEKGIQGLTIKNIAEKIGISEPAIYRHFDNKSAIIQGIVKLMNRDSGDHLNPDTITAAHISLIRSMFNEHTSRFLENPALTAIIFSEEIFNSDHETAELIKNTMQEKQAKLVKILKLGQSAGKIRSDIEAEQLSLVIIGSYRFLATKWRLQDYSFDFKTETTKLLDSLETIIKP